MTQVQREGRRISIGYRGRSTRELYPFNRNINWSGAHHGRAIEKQVNVVGHKRVSIGTLRKILGLEDVKDNSGRVVLDAPLELWANVKQRALDPALKEINKQSDIQMKIEFVARGTFRKVLCLGFRINARKNARGKGIVGHAFIWSAG